MQPTFIDSDWFSKYIPHWESALGHFKGMPNLRFLEVGCFEGRSTCWMLQNILTHPSSTITCVDAFEMSPDLWEICERMKLTVPHEIDIEANFRRNIETIGATKRVTTLKGTSREMLRDLPLDTFDFIYIDGSHTSRDVLTDAVLCFDLLKKNGVMAFDDYLWNCFPEAPLKNPKTGIQAFLDCYEGEYVLFWKAEQVFIRRTESSVCRFLHQGST